MDISPSAINEAAERLISWVDWIDVDGCVVDFLAAEFSEALVSDEPQLTIMLGSTLGNLFEDQRQELLSAVAEGMAPEDRFLVGVDLIKDPAIIEPAYNDSQGVTEEFSKNVIRVMQRELGCSCSPDDFRHHAPFVSDESRVEMRLHAVRPLEVSFSASSVGPYSMLEGEYLLTEISQKFSREGLASMAGDAGLAIEGWWTDPKGWVALALFRPA